MKILVCISHVPDTTSKINFKENNSAFDDTGVQFVINPYDEFGLTRAMWFKERQGASITVVTVGTVSVEPTLRKALAIGADEAIRVNLDPRDGFSVARELAEVISQGGYDLIIAGKESIDYNGGMVPGMVSAVLNCNFVNACIGLEIEGDVATAIREIDGGKETLRSGLPLVIAGQKGLVEEQDLRIPNMRGIMMARKKPLNVVEPVHQEALSHSVGFEKPDIKTECVMVEPDAMGELVRLLHEDAKVI
jgi:electron transfer flavoprotein beta subunit